MAEITINVQNAIMEYVLLKGFMGKVPICLLMAVVHVLPVQRVANGDVINPT